MIMLSIEGHPCYLELLFGFVDFLSTSINGFVYPSCMMTLTLLDVANISGFPLVGAELLWMTNEGSMVPMNLGIVLPDAGASFNEFSKRNSRTVGVVSNSEHNAFLLLWLCQHLALSAEFCYVVHW